MLLKKILKNPMPPNVGWAHSLGSCIAALLAVQILTGFLLSLYYSPTPEGATRSIEFIKKNVLMGEFVRTVHYWAPGIILIVIGLHMVRTFLAGAYKPPRRFNWISGVFLLLTVAAFAFTGQLLPWNQAGYWATKVSLEIIHSIPLLGPVLALWLKGGPEMGTLTLSRFYSLHIFLLPMALVGLIGIHIYLLEKHRPTQPDKPPSGETFPFYPKQFTRDVIVGSAAIGVLVLLSVFAGGPEDIPADPASINFEPRPEWYFIGHYQLLRILPGSIEIVGTFVVPALILALLFLLPFVDRNPYKDFRKRTFVVSMGLAIILYVVSFTISGFQYKAEGVKEWESMEAYEGPIKEGRKIFLSERCLECHSLKGRGGSETTPAPDLTFVGRRLDPVYMKDFIRNPDNYYPGTLMPPFTFSDRKLEYLVAYLESLDGSDD